MLLQRAQPRLFEHDILDLADSSAKLRCVMTDGRQPFGAGESGNGRLGFTFVDLFAGVGGFHAALGALGGKCVYAVEKDPEAAAVYERNWRMSALGDIVEDTEGVMRVPDHDVLVAGFPCQPFSKSGRQRGMDEARGTLFWNICEIIRVRRPAVVMLENVRNIAGPRHTHEWKVIIRSLRELGYQVSSAPVVFSPHLLPPDQGGRPQVRERIFVLGVRVDDLEEAKVDVLPAVPHIPVGGWSPTDWSLAEHLPLQTPDEVRAQLSLRLSSSEQRWIDAWGDFVRRIRDDGVDRLPGFPIWVDAFICEADLVVPSSTPTWKANFLRKNARFYTRHEEAIEAWLAHWDYLDGFPSSRRKFEWQAQDAESFRDVVIHLRPSGLRAKKANYVPALVAITQTSIIGERQRRLSTREAARLQGLPEWFDLGGQSEAAAYKQMGNGVNVGAAHFVFKRFIERNRDVINLTAPGLVACVDEEGNFEDKLERYWDPQRVPLRRPLHLEQASSLAS